MLLALPGIVCGVMVSHPGVAFSQAAVLPLPARKASAPTGTQFYNLVTSATEAVREQMILEQIAEGNVPDFLRTLKPVTATYNGHNATYHVTADYMAIGSDADFFRMPMSGPLAQQVADLCGATLSTRKICNDVYTQSTVKLAPYPFSPANYDIDSVPVFWLSNQAIENQRVQASAPLGALIAGIKKDVVVTPELGNRPAPLRVAIYGWHQLNGTPIQPLSLVHENTYEDYSHGIRLVKAELTVDSAPTTVGAVLNNPALAPLLSDEALPFGTYFRYPIPTPIVISVFPYHDNFLSAGRQLSSWVDRFTGTAVVPFSPSSPGGDGFILNVKDPSGGVNTARLGKISDTDYSVSCDIYCNFRPALSADGYERVGIFVRDDGNGIFEGTNGAGTIRGNNYSLTWDSNNGRVQCLKTVNGVPSDLLGSPMFVASSGWRTFGIDVMGSSLTFKIDGLQILNAVDTFRAAGQFGIGFHEYFITNANLLGTYADNFSATTLASSKVPDWALYQ